MLLNKYYFDWFNENVIARGARLLGKGLWKGGDQVLIDGALVNGSAATVGFFAGVVRRVQTGYLYHVCLLDGDRPRGARGLVPVPGLLGSPACSAICSVFSSGCRLRAASWSLLARRQRAWRSRAGSRSRRRWRRSC